MIYEWDRSWSYTATSVDAHLYHLGVLGIRVVQGGVGEIESSVEIPIDLLLF